jgi:hypothetical protein
MLLFLASDHRDFGQQLHTYDDIRSLLLLDMDEGVAEVMPVGWERAFGTRSSTCGCGDLNAMCMEVLLE